MKAELIAFAERYHVGCEKKSGVNNDAKVLGGATGMTELPSTEKGNTTDGPGIEGKI